jgi:hypothetical protein
MSHSIDMNLTRILAIVMVRNTLATKDEKVRRVDLVETAVVRVEGAGRENDRIRAVFYRLAEDGVENVPAYKLRLVSLDGGGGVGDDGEGVVGGVGLVLGVGDLAGCLCSSSCHDEVGAGGPVGLALFPLCNLGGLRKRDQGRCGRFSLRWFRLAEFAHEHCLARELVRVRATVFCGMIVFLALNTGFAAPERSRCTARVLVLTKLPKKVKRDRDTVNVIRLAVNLGHYLLNHIHIARLASHGFLVVGREEPPYSRGSAYETPGHSVWAISVGNYGDRVVQLSWIYVGQWLRLGSGCWQ